MGFADGVAAFVSVDFEGAGLAAVDLVDAGDDAAGVALADAEADADADGVGVAAGTSEAGASLGGAVVGSVEVMGGGAPRPEELSAGPAAIATEFSAPE